MRYRNENIDATGKIYGKFMVKPGVWVLTDRWSNFIYLLVGIEKALLIDTGSGQGNIREAVEEITDKGVIVVNTHGHYDHTGGNGWWSEVWMTESATEIAKKTFAPIHDEWAAEWPHQNYKMNIIKDGDTIDLGGRVVEVIAIPTHNESSISLLDKEARILFTGDELEGGQVLLFVRNQDAPRNELLRTHRANMMKLKERRSEYDFICPAHNGTMLYPDKYLDDFIGLSEGILNESIRPSPDSAGFGFPPDPTLVDGSFGQYAPVERFDYGEASFIFQK